MKHKDVKSVTLKVVNIKKYVPKLEFYVATPCTYCPNHPSNGGNGICHCVKGNQVTY